MPSTHFHEPPAGNPKLRVLIAEDQPVVRRGTEFLLTMAPDMECVGQASNGDEAVTLTRLLHPDVVLMDLHMPVKNGVAATREIARSFPGIHVLVLTTIDDDETIFEAIRAGAQGYVLKDASEDELLDAIRATGRGESRLTPPMARKVMNQLARTRDDTPGVPLEAHAAGATLSDSQVRLLELLTRGSVEREIAQKMSVTEQAIKDEVTQIIRKLHASARLQFALHTPSRTG